jgi:hypothetical protein
MTANSNVGEVSGKFLALCLADSDLVALEFECKIWHFTFVGFNFLIY